CRDLVVGLDVSRGMLEAGRRGMAEVDGLAWVRGDALAAPFGAAFDVVVCFGALGHLPKQAQGRFARAVAGVLAPGGRFVFVTSYMPRPWSRRYWLARGFNGAMRVRNLLRSPPFGMD